MSTERLFGIVQHLLNVGSTTSKELGKIFEVSTRTIYRDINKLSSSGVPIYTEQGRNGGISLLNNHILNKVFLTSEEKNNLLVLLKGVQTINPGISERSFSKLKSLFQEEFDDWLEVDFSTWYGKKEADKTFELIKQSILKKNVIEFNYIGSNEKYTKRNCQPYKLVFKNQSWYLNAFCLIRKEFRFFKITRMSSICITSQTFAPLTVPAPSELKSIAHEIPLVLKFSRGIFYRVYDEFPHENIEIVNSNTIIVKINLPFKEWLIRYLLSFGTHLKVVSPKSITDAMKKEVQNIIL
ncbi:helix-turn-helix transcriptional regulator [Lactococcus lactis]